MDVYLLVVKAVALVVFFSILIGSSSLLFAALQSFANKLLDLNVRGFKPLFLYACVSVSLYMLTLYLVRRLQISYLSNELLAILYYYFLFLFAAYKNMVQPRLRDAAKGLIAAVMTATVAGFVIVISLVLIFGDGSQI